MGVANEAPRWVRPVVKCGACSRKVVHAQECSSRGLVHSALGTVATLEKQRDGKKPQKEADMLHFCSWSIIHLAHYESDFNVI